MRDGTAGLTSFRRYTWWAVPGTTACLLVLFAGDWLAAGDLPIWARGLGAAALAAEVVASVVLLSRRLAPAPAVPAGWLIAGAAAAAVLAALALARHDRGLWAMAPATMVAITATYLPPRRRRRLIIGAALLAALLGGVLHAEGDLPYATLFPAGLVAFAAWFTLGPLWAWDIAGRLEQARHLSAELAIKDERLRFAAELHDIQGHHLQVIALKSELAARLAELDPGRAAAEMKEVQRLSTDALRDTRAVVQGYRRTSLDEEIANATRVLAAAGVDARMTLDPAAPPAPGAHHLMGLVMREATTNVLRHSQARHADIDYRVENGAARLRVGNDGAGEQRAGSAGPQVGEEAGAGGTGLRSLAERLRAAGGELTWEHADDRFVVAASLPVGGEV